MLFDTGATNTLITLSAAASLDLKPVGSMNVTIADGSVVQVPVAEINAIEIDGRIKKKLKVAVAPPSMPIGLLGHDFFEGYDISIKEDVIEFSRRGG
jgi:aspartyl protease family protein